MGAHRQDADRQRRADYRRPDHVEARERSRETGARYRSSRGAGLHGAAARDSWSPTRRFTIASWSWRQRPLWLRLAPRSRHPAFPGMPDPGGQCTQLRPVRRRRSSPGVLPEPTRTRRARRTTRLLRRRRPPDSCPCLRQRRAHRADSGAADAARRPHSRRQRRPAGNGCCADESVNCAAGTRSPTFPRRRRRPRTTHADHAPASAAARSISCPSRYNRSIMIVHAIDESP